LRDGFALVFSLAVLPYPDFADYRLPQVPRDYMMTAFTHLGLADGLLRAVQEKGYTTPSPIQEQAIPAILQGRDVMAAAQTGTGKTAGFTLPLLQRLSTGTAAASNRCRALVLTPTRELAAQVAESVATYGKHLGLRSAVVYGGVKINPQMMALRKGADILVATPGRLMDLFEQRAIRFDDLEVLVLDEADRMLDMGFIHDIKKILALLPKQRQNLLFSATFSGDIRELAMGILQNPVEIDVSPRNSTADTVDQWVHPVDKHRKPELLSHLITSRSWKQALVFTRTKHGANKLAAFLEKEGIRSAAIHGNKSQSARLKALEDFKRCRVNILVATDIAARGLDIVELPQVVNFDLPNVPEDYVHRIGRTGRAGAKGRAISLVSADEFRQLWDIERLIGRKLTRDDIKGYEPEHALPESKGLKGAPPVKKPKRKEDDRRPAKPRPAAKPSSQREDNPRPAAQERRPHHAESGRFNESRPQTPRTYAGDGSKPPAFKRPKPANGEARSNAPYPGKSPSTGSTAHSSSTPYPSKSAPQGKTANGSGSTHSPNYKGKNDTRPAQGGKKPTGKPSGNGYIGVYRPPVTGDYRTEEKLQSFGNRADIPLEKLKALDEKPIRKRPAGSAGFSDNKRPQNGYNGHKKPNKPRGYSATGAGYSAAGAGYSPAGSQGASGKSAYSASGSQGYASSYSMGAGASGGPGGYKATKPATSVKASYKSKAYKKPLEPDAP
jgi:ATP-dependent RNA helicase RhlE